MKNRVKAFEMMVARDGFGQNYIHSVPMSTVIQRSPR
jgi:hypothetical protein